MFGNLISDAQNVRKMLLTPSKTPNIVPKVIVQPVSEYQEAEPSERSERRKTRSSSARSSTSTSSGNRLSTQSTENAFMQLSTTSGDINVAHLDGTIQSDGTNQGQRMQEVVKSPKPGYVVKVPSSPDPPSYSECCPPPPSFYGAWQDGTNPAKTMQGDTNLTDALQDDKNEKFSMQSDGTNQDGRQ